MNHESIEAYQSISEHRPSVRVQLLDFIKSKAQGATADEIIEAFPSMRYSTLTARLSEMRFDGTIVKIGTRATRSNRAAAILKEAA